MCDTPSSGIAQIRAHGIGIEPRRIGASHGCLPSRDPPDMSVRHHGRRRWESGRTVSQRARWRWGRRLSSGAFRCHRSERCLSFRSRALRMTSRLPPTGRTRPNDSSATRMRGSRSIVGVDGEGVYGEPGDGLARLSENVDLLVVGSRGHGSLGRLMNGRTSTYLAGRVHCPLLVLPRPKSASGETR
jgi:hypothetical protein